MRKDRLDKLYDRFTPEERFRLTLEALAREDEQEAERLWESCPRRTYTMNDAAYGDRMRAGLQITMAICLDLAPHLAKLRMIEAFRMIQPYVRTVSQNKAHFAYFDGHWSGSHHAWRASGMEGDPPGWERDDEKAERNADPGLDEALDKWTGQVKAIDDRLSKSLEALERNLVEKGLAVWSAFSDFCRDEMGLDSKELLAAFANPFAERAGELEDLAARLEVTPDPESVEEYRTLLLEVWRRVIERG